MVGEPAKAGERRTAVATVQNADDGLRLDRWLKRHYQGIPAGKLFKLIRTGQVRVNGARVDGGRRLAAGDQIRVPPMLSEVSAEPDGAARRALSEPDRKFMADLVLFHDEDIIVINKPAGLAVQGGSRMGGRHVDRLLDAFVVGSEERPRLVHRLDRETSGLLVLARSRRVAAWLAEFFRSGGITKTYWAFVQGVPNPREGEVRTPVPVKRRPVSTDGASEERAALTRYRLLDRAGNRASWLELNPVTGRTHQLRRHCLTLGTPILGDPRYGGRRLAEDRSLSVPHLCLHARRISVPSFNGKAARAFTAPLPDHMREVMTRLGLEAPAQS